MRNSVKNQTNIELDKHFRTNAIYAFDKGLSNQADEHLYFYLYKNLGSALDVMLWSQIHGLVKNKLGKF